MAELTAPRTNRSLLWAYMAPYLAYVAAASLLADRVPREVDYAIRLLVTGGILFGFRDQLRPLVGRRAMRSSIAWGVVAGLFGVGIWVALILPFQDPGAGEAWTLSQLVLRIAAAILVVPLAEELLFRRYLMGLVVQWTGARLARQDDPIGEVFETRSVLDLAPGAWTWGAVLVSSLAFALGHAPAQWVAASAYGALMALCWIQRGDLVTPIAAHATTNLVLYVYVYASGNWGLW